MACKNKFASTRNRKTMLPKKNYYIKFGTSETIIKSDGKIITFKLKDRDDFKTIHAGKIGDFTFFESQIKLELIKLGFNKWSLKRKVAYVAIPINISQADIKMIIDSFDWIGFKEIYTIFEHHALIYNTNKENSFTKTFGIINIDDDRVDFGLIDGRQISKSSSIDLGFERMNRYFSNSKLLSNIGELILDEIEYFFGATINEIEIIITGNRKSQIGVTNKLLQNKGIRLIEIENIGVTIIEGLESISKLETLPVKEGEKLTKRSRP